MSAQMDPGTRDAMRAALIDHVRSRSAPRRWWRRWPVGLGLVVVVAGGGTAVAADLLRVPGSAVVSAFADGVTLEATGSAVLEMGPPPGGATHVEIELQCLTPGSIRFADGASVMCSAADFDDGAAPGVVTYSMPLEPGQSSTTITTSPEAQWRANAHYSERHTSPLGVNADGNTYGTDPGAGDRPTLTAVGLGESGVGYVYTVDLEPPGPRTPQEAVTWKAPDVDVPIYESDGRTAIGVWNGQGRPLNPGEVAPPRPPWTTPEATPQPILSPAPG